MEFGKFGKFEMLNVGNDKQQYNKITKLQNRELKKIQILKFSNSKFSKIVGLWTQILKFQILKFILKILNFINS